MLKMIRTLAVAAMAFAITPAVAEAQTYAYNAPEFSIGRVAYDNARLKVLPNGYHDFVQVQPFDGRMERITDAFCYQWEKTISVEKQVRLELNDATLRGIFISVEEAKKTAIRKVNDANKAEVCQYGTARFGVEAVAVRGYQDEMKRSQPVRIFKMVAENGQVLYSGMHL